VLAFCGFPVSLSFFASPISAGLMIGVVFWGEGRGKRHTAGTTALVILYLAVYVFDEGRIAADVIAERVPRQAPANLVGSRARGAFQIARTCISDYICALESC